MKFFRRKDKKKNGGDSPRETDLPFQTAGGYQQFDGDGRRGTARVVVDPDQIPVNSFAFYGPCGPPTTRSGYLASRLDSKILDRIFAFVCPQAKDESYETCEESALDDCCMLCDLRDLANCGRVNKKWRPSAVNLMYHSIRIDSVHYCQREAILAEKRKRRSRFDRNGIPEDTAQARLKLLARTLREDPTRLGARVRFLKTPYMLREACPPDLARTIAVLPRLRYVDLPKGMFADEPAHATLRLEVQARCPDLRKMTYAAGAERSLELLAGGRVWTNMEVLELSKMNVDPLMLRHVLAALPCLRALKVMGTRGFGDAVMVHNDNLPPFPALAELVLDDTPHVTAMGLAQYLQRPDASHSLHVLTLTGTGVTVGALPEVLAAAAALRTLAVTETVGAALSATVEGGWQQQPFQQPQYQQPQQRPLLASASLRTLRFEITERADVAGPYAAVAESYYDYLIASLLAGGFPSLRAVYVRDIGFPEKLLGLPLPPAAPFAFGGGQRPLSSSSSYSGFLSPQSYLSPPGSGGFASPSLGGMPIAQQGMRRGSGTTTGGSSSAMSPGQFGSNNPFAAGRGGSSGRGGAMAGPLTHTLEVFTKGDDDLDWSQVKMAPGMGGYGGGSPGSPSGRFSVGSWGSGGLAGQRPVSSYGLGADVAGRGWDSGAARRSVMVNNSGGGFLAVPEAEVRPGTSGSTGGGYKRFGGGEDLWPRPMSSAGDKKGDRDLWR